MTINILANYISNFALVHLYGYIPQNKFLAIGNAFKILNI